MLGRGQAQASSPSDQRKKGVEKTLDPLRRLGKELTESANLQTFTRTCANCCQPQLSVKTILVSLRGLEDRLCVVLSGVYIALCGGVDLHRCHFNIHRASLVFSLD